MKLDKNTVKRIADLSKLEFTSDETTAILKDMNQMLEFIDQLKELDTSNICLLYTSPSPRDLG